MKFLFSLSLLVIPNVSAFTTTQTTPVHNHAQRQSTSITSTTQLFIAATTGTTSPLVVQAGGGIPVVPAGDRLLFDPAQEGMLGGTEALNDRLTSGANYQYSYLPTTTVTVTVTTADTTTNIATTDCQAWLEDLGVPGPFAKASQPVVASVLGRAKLIDDAAPGDIQHVVLKLPQGFHYVEGQSLSVIPPGIDSKTNKPHKPRLYSIASTRYGDVLDGTTVSLCVRRAEYFDPAAATVDASKKGVCSNFLCDAAPGTIVQVAGPVGKTMLLPEDPTTDVIMVATGTGIAPFRSFLHRLFMEETVARHQFQARAWLVLGVPVTGGLLYPQEFAAMQQVESGGSLEVTYAISREMQNKQGGKLYVQDVLAERADDLMERLDNGAHIYFCGLKGMMPGILEALEQVAISKGLDWGTKLKEYKSNHQWHVEVY